MKLKLIGAAVAAIGALACSSAFADNLKFKISNESKYIISSFQTNEGKGWSKNWLDGDVDAGETMDMQFLKDGPCAIQVRVGWRTEDGGQEVGEPWNIDICKAHTVYFDGDKVTYD